MFKMKEDTTQVNPPKRYSILMERKGHTEVLDIVHGESARNDAITRYATALVRKNESGRIYSEISI